MGSHVSCMVIVMTAVVCVCVIEGSLDTTSHIRMHFVGLKLMVIQITIP